MWWLAIVGALGMSPEICDGLDNDLNGLIDDPLLCGSSSVVDPNTGNAYTIGGINTRDNADATCTDLGAYVPAEPTSESEMDVLNVYTAVGALWIGIDRVAGTTVIGDGTPAGYSAYVNSPGADGCTTLSDFTADGEVEWQFVPSFDCPVIPHAVLCEAACDPVTAYEDSDGDGVGAGPAFDTCQPLPAHYVEADGDCNDDAPDVRPGNDEACDGVDNDCDEQIDEGLFTFTVYDDLDGDGVGSGAGYQSCDVPAGASIQGGDCDDANPAILPGATELCDGIDNDCNLLIDDDAVPAPYFEDTDGDGFGAGSPTFTCTPTVDQVLNDSDCDDGDHLQFPGADERCNEEDDDCDGTTDEDAIDPSTFYADGDADGFGVSDDTAQSCAPGPGYALFAGDCAPSDPFVHPNAAEACVDGIDNDCDSLIDAADPDFTEDAVVFWIDQDGDGVGVPGADIGGCSGDQPSGYVVSTAEADCDDAEPARAPGLDELCDNLDNDCDTLVDEGFPLLDYWPDTDLDGFGDDAANPINACTAPLNSVRNQLDCDDSDATISPNAHEVCDGIDNDCNGPTDDGLPTESYYPDTDLDGFGDSSAVPAEECGPPGELILDNTDCDDGDPHIYPGAPDAPEDQIDSDCDGTVEVPPTPPPPDTDGDGVPDPIDPTPNGSEAAAAVPPPLPSYGCGCATSDERWAWSWLRRR